MPTPDSDKIIKRIITRIMGVFIPHRKKRRRGMDHVTLRFVIVGPIPAKKNNQVPLVQLGKAERFVDGIFREKGSITRAEVKQAMEMVYALIIPSNRYQTWENNVALQINAQMKQQFHVLRERGLFWPLSNCSMAVYHFWQDTRKRDLSNRLESIQDLFTRCQVISDDNDDVLWPVKSDCCRYSHTEMTRHVTVINLTAYYKPGKQNPAV